jgi:hypothetical protein
MFIYWANKHYEELWRLEHRALAAIKTVKEQIRQNLLWRQKIMSRELNISIQSMLRLIRENQHDSAPPLKGTHPQSCFEGDPKDKSGASPPVAR